MPYGITTTAHTGLPDNVDLAALNTIRTRDGFGLGEVLTFARSASRMFAGFDWPGSEEMAGIVAALCYTVADDQISWRTGDLNATRIPRDNQGQVIRQRRTRSGSQVPEVRALVPLPAYTWDTTRPGSRAMSRDEVEGDIMSALEAMAIEVYLEFIRSVITKAARPVIGSSTGQSVGWVGATDQDYQPGRKKGESFAGHSHYLANGTTYADSAAGRRALFEAMAATVMEHGRRHQSGAPFLILHGSDSRAAVEADAQYGAPTVIGVNPGQDTATVTDVPFYGHGKDKKSGGIFVDVGPGLPEHYFVLAKSYGANSPRNPVRIAVPEDIGFGPTLFDARSNYPIDANTPIDPSLLLNLDMVLLYGMGVQEPEAGAAGLIDASGTTWADPTVS